MEIIELLSLPPRRSVFISASIVMLLLECLFQSSHPASYSGPIKFSYFAPIPKLKSSPPKRTSVFAFKKLHSSPLLRTLNSVSVPNFTLRLFPTRVSIVFPITCSYVFPLTIETESTSTLSIKFPLQVVSILYPSILIFPSFTPPFDSVMILMSWAFIRVDPGLPVYSSMPPLVWILMPSPPSPSVWIEMCSLAVPSLSISIGSFGVPILINEFTLGLCMMIRSESSLSSILILLSPPVLITLSLWLSVFTGLDVAGFGTAEAMMGRSGSPSMKVSSTSVPLCRGKCMPYSAPA